MSRGTVMNGGEGTVMNDGKGTVMNDGKGTVIYDGDCGFCTTSTLWAKRHVLPDDVVVVPWQGCDLDAFGLSSEQTATSVWFVPANGDPLGGAAAIAAMLRSSGMPFGPVGRLMQLPGIAGLSERCYRIVSRNRHRLPGSTAACEVSPRA